MNDDFEKILKNIKYIPEIMERSKYVVSQINVYGESGAGLVRVKVNGKKNVIKIRIDDSLIKEDKFILEDLVTEAINNANKKVDVEIRNKMINLMNEMGIPNHFISMIPFINSK